MGPNEGSVIGNPNDCQAAFQAKIYRFPIIGYIKDSVFENVPNLDHCSHLLNPECTVAQANNIRKKRKVRKKARIIALLRVIILAFSVLVERMISRVPFMKPIIATWV